MAESLDAAYANVRRFHAAQDGWGVGERGSEVWGGGAGGVLPPPKVV